MTKIEECCIKWLNENYGLMEIFTVNIYVDSVFHMKNGKCILEYNKAKGVVHVNYSEIWVFFEFYFNIFCVVLSSSKNKPRFSCDVSEVSPSFDAFVK